MSDEQQRSVDEVGPPPAADTPDLERRRQAIANRLFGAHGDRDPVTIGRYEVRRHLGAGSMGVVYEAYDASLERHVAVKLLRGGETDDPQEARLHREAKAMARLSHPNVATVYEVGEHEGETFIAMEYIDGPTLRQWLQTTKTPQEIVATLCQAGEGLDAAHDASLVHRDFKPDNVLVGPAGGTVVDFGIAYSRTAIARETAMTPDAETLSASGSMAGTPAYMAPEQLDAGTTSPASDQFSFCVTLYEALVGRRPWSAPTVEALLTAMREGPPELPGPELAGHWATAVRRGLAFEPVDRHESMRALLHALRTDPAVARRRWFGGTVAVGVIAAAGFSAARATEPEDPCVDADAEIDAVWSDAVASDLAGVFADTGVPYAESTWIRARGLLDAWAEQWKAMRRDVCEAVEVDQTQTEESGRLRRDCLQAGLGRFEATLAALARVDAGKVDAAAPAIAALPDVSACGDLVRLRRQRPNPVAAEIADKAAPVERTLDRFEVEDILGGRFGEEEMAELTKAVQSARQLEHGALLARALYLTGEILIFNQGEEDSGIAALRESMTEALAAGDDHRFVQAAGLLGQALSHVREDGEGGLQLIALADAQMRRLGRPPRLEQRLHEVRGAVLTDLSRFEEARIEIAASIEALEQRQAPVEELLQAQMRAARVVYMQGDATGALQRLEELTTIAKRELTPGHPIVLRLHHVRATCLLALARLEEAEVHARKAVEGYEELRESEGAVLANSLANLAGVLMQRNDLETAEATYDRALELLQERRGEGTAAEGRMLAGLSYIRQRQGRLEEARELAERSIEVTEAHRGSNTVEPAGLRLQLAQILRAQGNLDRAVEVLRKAIEIFEAVGAEDHRGVALSHQLLAGIAHQRGDVDAAAREYAAAYEGLMTATHGASVHTVEAAATLAGVLADANRTDEASRWLEQARTDAEQADVTDPKLQTMLDGVAAKLGA